MSIASSTTRRPLVDRIKQLLESYARLSAEIKTVDDWEQAMTLSIENEAAERRQPYRDELSQVMSELTELLSTRRNYIRRLFGRTFEHADVTVKWHVVPRALEAPADTKPVIRKLLAMRGGRRYLRVTYNLNRRTLVQARPELLRSLGLAASRREHLSIRAVTDDEPVTLKVRRYPDGP